MSQTRNMWSRCQTHHEIEYRHEAKLYQEQLLTSSAPKTLEDVRVRYEHAKAAGVNPYAPKPRKRM